MPLTIPPELKKITPYVRRAEELDKDKTNAESRLVAYYCRQYAVHTGIDLATTPAGKTCLGDLLSVLEQEKQAMNNFTRDEAKFLCRKFADKIFDKADLDDRTGDADKNTAKTFYAAASFLEILHQFYKSEEDAEELAEIKKRAVYGKWKATEILKAIKEGRQPTPGGYGEDSAGPESDQEADIPAPEVPSVSVNVGDEQPEEEETTSEPDAPVVRLPSAEDSNDDDAVNTGKEEKVVETVDEEDSEKDTGMEVELGPPPTYDFAPPMGPPPLAPSPAAKPPITYTPAAPAPPPAPKPNPPPVEKKKGIFSFGMKKSRLSKAEMGDAMELTKFALAALEDKNTDLAAERLQQALEVLNRHKS